MDRLGELSHRAEAYKQRRWGSPLFSMGLSSRPLRTGIHSGNSYLLADLHIAPLNRGIVSPPIIMMGTRRLLKEEITYSLAKEREVNILHQLGYFDGQCRFFSHRNDRREWMKAVVAHHLGFRSPDVCHVVRR